MPLLRLLESGTIRRVLRGIYDYPRTSELLGQQMGPDMHQVAQALARKFAWRIHPDGTAAMNLLGLSTQVPSQYVFLSDGPTRSYCAGKTSLNFRHVGGKEIGFQLPESSIIVHAIRQLGREHIDLKTIERIRNWLPASKRAKVAKDTARATGWIYEIIRQICQEERAVKIYN